MPDFGLTLPDHDLTPQEFKELARRIGRAAFVPLFLKFYERVITSEATVEEQRKALADIGRWTSIEEDRKTDPNANLPVFNIIFGNSASHSASIEAVEIVTEVQPPVELPTLDDEELQILEGVSHAKFQASPPAARPERNVAEAVAALGPADSPGESAGSGAPAATGLQRPSQRERQRSQRLAALAPALSVPSPLPLGLPADGGDSGLAPSAPLTSALPIRSANPFEESLNALDEALGL